MDSKKRIVHILHRSRFTGGYIEYMNLHFAEYEHTFIMVREGYELSLNQCNDIIFLDNFKELNRNKNIHSLLLECNQIIVSGVWDMIVPLYFCNNRILKKSYFHFWGGDFYKYRQFGLRDWKTRRDKYMLRSCLLRSAGALNLIVTDFPEMKKILRIPEIHHLVAPMPKSPKEDIDYSLYCNQPTNKNSYRILVGNSATIQNQHKEIFDILLRFKEENIEIVCPLSYGWKEYGEQVLKLGKEYFGEKFHPITESLPKEDYVKLLASCDIGIFNNNRQQAMGNIFIFVRLGKKVFLRDDTSMWEHFEKIGYHFNKTEELKTQSLETIMQYDEECGKKNRKALENWEEQTLVMWDKVFREES